MLYYLQSDNPNKYECIKFSANPQLGKGKHHFRILRASTIASFLITTNDDYIIFNVNNNDIKITFNDCCKYDRYDLPKILNQQYLHNTGLTVSDNDEGTLTIESQYNFTIKEATHRIKLLFGLYHSSLPINSQSKKIIINSVPYVCYGNNLYIRSRISSVVGFAGAQASFGAFNSHENVSYTSICYHISEMFIPGVPIISRIPGNQFDINSYDLTNLEFTLVDFQNEPIKLKAPLNLTVEINVDDI